MGTLLHILFFFGATLWWYMVLPKFEKNEIINDKLEFLDGVLLGISHMFSFSVGNFVHYEYYRRMFHKKPEREVLRHYSFYGACLVMIPPIVQTICLHLRVASLVYYLAYMLAFIPVFAYESVPNQSLLHWIWGTLVNISLSLFVIPPCSLELRLFQRKFQTGNNSSSSFQSNDFIPRFEWILLTSSLFVGIGLAFLQHSLKTRNSLPPQKLSPPGTIPKIKCQSRISQQARLEKFPPPFPNSWYKFANSVDFEPGQVKHISCLGRDFVIFRSDDNSKKVYVMDAYCPHLGANLGIDSKVSGNCVVCPFHGWQFRGEDGHCNHIPYSNTIPSNAKIFTYPTIEHAGLILVWFHVDKQPPSFHPPKLPQIDSGSLKWEANWEAEVEMHIQDFAENSADSAHFGFLHTSLSFRFLKDFFYVSHHTAWRVGGGKGRFGDDPEIDNNLNENGDDTHLCSFTDKAQLHLFTGKPVGPEVTAVVTFVGPAVVYFRFFTPYGQLLLLKCFLPLDGFNQRVTDVWYVEDSVPFLMAKFVRQEAQNAFVDDMTVWANKTYSSKALIIKEDGPMHKLRRWCKQFYSASSRIPITISTVSQERLDDYSSENERKITSLCSSNSSFEW